MTFPALNLTTLRAGMATVFLGLLGLRPKLDVLPVDEALGDVVERPLQDPKDLLLGKSGFACNTDDQFSFRHAEFSCPTSPQGPPREEATTVVMDAQHQSNDMQRFQFKWRETWSSSAPEVVKA